MNKSQIILAVIAGMLSFNPLVVSSQDLDSLLNLEAQPEKSPVTATFKSTRIVNGHSVERMRDNVLEFRVSHRFGQLNEGSYNLWGLDRSTIHLALEYGITDWLEFGIGRSTYEKTYDGFGKVSLLRQSKGEKNIPVHLSYLVSTELISSKENPAMTNNFKSRLSFIQQILIARKLNEQISLQLTPTYIHRNLKPTPADKYDLFAIGGGARYKLTRRIALNAEYFYVFHESALSDTYYNPLAFGIDIETGGHVFQIMLTNSEAMREGGFIGKTTGSWGDGGIHLGFNISRVFSFNKDKQSTYE